MDKKDIYIEKFLHSLLSNFTFYSLSRIRRWTEFYLTLSLFFSTLPNKIIAFVSFIYWRYINFNSFKLRKKNILFENFGNFQWYLIDEFVETIKSKQKNILIASIGNFRHRKKKKKNKRGSIWNISIGFMQWSTRVITRMNVNWRKNSNCISLRCQNTSSWQATHPYIIFTTTSLTNAIWWDDLDLVYHPSLFLFSICK